MTPVEGNIRWDPCSQCSQTATFMWWEPASFRTALGGDGLMPLLPISSLPVPPPGSFFPWQSYPSGKATVPHPHPMPVHPKLPHPPQEGSLNWAKQESFPGGVGTGGSNSTRGFSITARAVRVLHPKEQNLRKGVNSCSRDWRTTWLLRQGHGYSTSCDVQDSPTIPSNSPKVPVERPRKMKPIPSKKQDTVRATPEGWHLWTLISTWDDPPLPCLGWVLRATKVPYSASYSSIWASVLATKQTFFP